MATISLAGSPSAIVSPPHAVFEAAGGSARPDELSLSTAERHTSPHYGLQSVVAPRHGAPARTIDQNEAMSTEAINSVAVSAPPARSLPLLSLQPILATTITAVAANVPEPGMAPPPYSARPNYSAPRQLTWAHATSAVVAGEHIVPSPPPHRPRSFLEPLELPSPFTKAPKSRVSNFREGLKEGGRGAWAELREGMKGPVGLTWYWAKEGGVFGALGGLGYGTTILALCPISASIAFLNHSSRGAIRSVRSAKDQRRLSKSKSAQSGRSSSPSSPSPLSPIGTLLSPNGTAPNPNPLSMRRTSTMGSAVTSRSRRSRLGGFLSRVTTARSESGPITPEQEDNVSGQGSEGVVVQAEEEAGRVTPFPISMSPVNKVDWAIPKGKNREERGTTPLEMDTKWGAPPSPSFGPSGSGDGQGYTMGSALAAEGALVGMDRKVNRLEMDAKWGSGAFASLGPPVFPGLYEGESQAGPSAHGTPQLERDIKWPILPVEHGGSGLGVESGMERSQGAERTEERDVRRSDEGVVRAREEVTRMEMDLKSRLEVVSATSRELKSDNLTVAIDAVRPDREITARLPEAPTCLTSGSARSKTRLSAAVALEYADSVVDALLADLLLVAIDPTDIALLLHEEGYHALAVLDGTTCVGWTQVTTRTSAPSIRQASMPAGQQGDFHHSFTCSLPATGLEAPSERMGGAVTRW
ncbi:uncharacterized protein MKK02DRAFT_29848 [Dioszegia hungarica]|uniref:Uncharacterized protein n=1 Tax=Dioszegia hungarica TaxID=4972 RepID=A0AA38LZA6_9TREE|nr:uncharacterized protein MKK02DRAFT_29848 [Dioszegia hungarica]KAI9639884.1 hypothetical protein MKK02DRAFT_29848 [Dioszegia hungarica]